MLNLVDVLETKNLNLINKLVQAIPPDEHDWFLEELLNVCNDEELLMSIITKCKLKSNRTLLLLYKFKHKKIANKLCRLGYRDDYSNYPKNLIYLNLFNKSTCKKENVIELMKEAKDNFFINSILISIEEKEGIINENYIN